ncbi:MAG: group II intron reverse transcriptase domain-containing protein [Fimbriimonadia bacterium]|nr:group II intron reverse transcriptase domain-containing protein [Fimbriimonadia bacterium]
MKTHKSLLPKVWEFENLWLAAQKAQKGKRRLPEVYTFNADLETHLLQLQRELKAGTWAPGAYRDFTIYEPKRRLISAAPYRDRVVHHAVYRVLEPIFDSMFIYDSYACRLGKGTHAAAARYTQFCRQAAYVLKCDIEKYFDSVCHDKLLLEIGRTVQDDGFMELMKRIIESNNSRQGAIIGKGLPIGNLTSQFFANIYLNRFDHWLKEDLRLRFYIRYVDDFVILHDDKRYLHQLRRAISGKLEELHLRLHPKKQNVFPVSEGCDFMGYRVWRNCRRLRPSSGYRAQRRLKNLAKRFSEGEIQIQEVRQSLMGWIGHARHCDSKELRESMFQSIIFRRSGVAR